MRRSRKGTGTHLVGHDHKLQDGKACLCVAFSHRLVPDVQRSPQLAAPCQAAERWCVFWRTAEPSKAGVRACPYCRARIGWALRQAATRTGSVEVAQLVARLGRPRHAAALKPLKDVALAAEVAVHVDHEGRRPRRRRAAHHVLPGATKYGAHEYGQGGEPPKTAPIQFVRPPKPSPLNVRGTRKSSAAPRTRAACCSTAAGTSPQ